jgi:RNA-directed DNA polymerase
VNDLGAAQVGGPATWETLNSPVEVPALRAAGDQGPCTLCVIERTHGVAAHCAAKNERSATGRRKARETGADADGMRESEDCEVAMKPGNGVAAGPGRAKAVRVEDELQEGIMTTPQTVESMSPKLLKVAERAKNDPQLRFRSLAHLIDESMLKRAFKRLRKNAAVGVDGVTVEAYGQDLESRLQDLIGRLKAKRYRHQPIRRVHIPKARGKTRPIGISSVEDKVVQGALRGVLEAIYEQDFLDCSFGFRPGRGAHDALRKFNRIAWTGEVKWVLEADIESFFDSIDRKMLMEMLQERIADGSLLRLVGKCLHAGVLEGGEYSELSMGTAQGSSLSPLLGNIYLHHVLDVWFERTVRPRLRGRATLIRYADDFVIGFERKDDAARVMRVIEKRMTRFGLRLHPDKTRLIPFAKPAKNTDSTKGSATFDFLGFTLFWRRSHWGGWALGMKTMRSRAAKIVRSIAEWCRSQRHLSIAAQHRALCRRLEGHMNYFGVNGNLRALNRLVLMVRAVWFKWLKRRSQRSSMTVERFAAICDRFPMPRPSVRVQIWLSTP